MGFAGELMNDKGIAIYYIIGFIIFVVLFIFMLIRTIKMPKATLIKYKYSILDDEKPFTGMTKDND
jgi:hypothetical protein